MRTDRHTDGERERESDMTKLRVAYRNFVKALKTNRFSTFFVLVFPENFPTYLNCGRRVAHFIR